jgi:hypothetical protein
MQDEIYLSVFLGMSVYKNDKLFYQTNQRECEGNRCTYYRI